MVTAREVPELGKLHRLWNAVRTQRKHLEAPWSDALLLQEFLSQIFSVWTSRLEHQQELLILNFSSWTFHPELFDQNFSTPIYVCELSYRPGSCLSSVHSFSTRMRFTSKLIDLNFSPPADKAFRQTTMWNCEPIRWSTLIERQNSRWVGYRLEEEMYKHCST